MSYRIWMSLVVLAVGASVVAAVGPARSARKTGGTLRLSSIIDVGSVDPAIAYDFRSWMIE